jgi:hypothetical protein
MGEQTSVERRRTRTPYGARRPRPGQPSRLLLPFPLDVQPRSVHEGVSVLYEAYISRMMLRPGAVAYRTLIEYSIERKWTC